MPLSLHELYPDGETLDTEEVEDGRDICVAVTLKDGARMIVIAISPEESTFSYVFGIEMGDYFPDPEELAEECNNRRNIRALMLPGDSHTIALEPEYEGPEALVIRDLGRSATQQF